MKVAIIKKLIISSLGLFIFLLVCLFPSNDTTYEENLVYTEYNKEVVYLLNSDNLVSRVEMVLKSSDTLDKVKEIIEILTIDNTNTYMPTNFYSVIPKNTKILNLSLEDNLLKIDFSEYFLNTTKDMERTMIEALVYSLTELDNIDNIIIFVEGSSLTNLPFSKEELPSLLNRDMGVNVIYEINSLYNTDKTTIYYGSEDNNYFYYIPVTYVANSNSEKVEIIIERLKTSPIYESKFISYLNDNVKLTNYEILEDEIKLSFNNLLFSDLNDENTLEKVKYMISLSIIDAYNIESVDFLLE